MVAGKLLDLLGLGVDHIRGVLEMVVDELLVRLVDKGAEEEDGGGDQGKTPEWDDLNQVVGEERSNKGLYFRQLDVEDKNDVFLRQQKQRHSRQRQCVEIR